MWKNYEVPGWILCVGALVRMMGCPGVGLGLESAFPSYRLAFAWFASGGPACGVGVLM